MTVPRERLAALLGSKALSAPASVRLEADKGDLHLEVEGIGRVHLPVPAQQARRLAELGRPAKFGRGEDTLTDATVRDTWEIPASLVRTEWTGAFEAVLDTVREGLGLPSRCTLTAGFHSMLVYGPGQFFVAHQDSEKDDTMIGSLVVALPSAHTGGEFVIEHGGEATVYEGSKNALSLVAFYADCPHQVLPVKSGHRITLTYDLLLNGETRDPTAVDAATVNELARCLDEHFATRVTSRHGRAETDPPNRLVYLLDHEYTARGLSWSRLKGADARRVSAMRAAADRSGHEVVLALADIQETWSAFEADQGYGHRGWDGYGYDSDIDDEDDWDDADDGAEYDLEELIDSTIRLTHWTGLAGDNTEEISLFVGDAEVCASTHSVDLRPYASEYEGYMGNYGNTMDRWYRRAALVVWPRDRHFANRAEVSPAWALDELWAQAGAGDLEGARAAAVTLAPFWDIAVRAQHGARFFGKALRTAGALDDGQTAWMLLRTLRLEDLTTTNAASLAKLAGRYGEPWVGELLRAWFGERRSWAYASGQDGEDWHTSLPRLCEALHIQGGTGTAIARRLLELSWERLGGLIHSRLTSQTPSNREKLLGDLGRPVSAVLTAAATTRAGDLRDKVVGSCRAQGDEVLACVMPALRAATDLPPETRRNGGLDDLAADCAARLRTRLALPLRADDDWSIELPEGCACELCGTLGAFLRDPARRTCEWPLAKARRQHVHSRIDTAELPVRHQTRRQGRPYTLVLTKTEKLFEHERRARVRDEADLEWLTAEWKLTGES